MRLKLCPSWSGGFEGDAVFGERVEKVEAPGVEAQGGGGNIEGLGVAGDLAVREVNRVADDREAELPEVSADLVGATGDGAGLDESGVIREAFDDAEFGSRRQSFGEINVACAGFARFGGDGGVAGE